MDTAEAARVLGIKLPTTVNALRSIYCRRAHDEHPDHSRANDAHDRFIRVQQAYEQIWKDASVLSITEDQVRDLICDDGVTKVADLGKGLAPTVNGKPCPECDGKGFHSHALGNEHDCPDCEQLVPNFFDALAALRTGRFNRVRPGWKYACNKCGGSGIFKLRNGTPKGKCFKCNGEGHVLDRSGQNHCPTCKGTGLNPTKRRRMDYIKCFKCEGCGEILVFNPVLPKGLLSFGR